MSIQSRFRSFRLAGAVSLGLILATFAFGQSTGAIQGTVTDASGAAVPNATVTVKDPAHGVARAQATDSTGVYFVPSLPVGTYSVEVKAPGLALTEAKGLMVEVGSTVTQDFPLAGGRPRRGVGARGARLWGETPPSR